MNTCEADQSINKNQILFITLKNDERIHCELNNTDKFKQSIKTNMLIIHIMFSRFQDGNTPGRGCKALNKDTNSLSFLYLLFCKFVS